MPTPQLLSRLSYFTETTPGSGANAATWLASGVSIRHLASELDVSPFQQTMLEDMRDQRNLQDYEPRIKGIKGGIEFAFQTYLHGMAASPADGSPAVATAFSNLLGHCFGGQHLGTTDELVTGGAHSTTDIELTDTLPIGSWVRLVDADGIAHRRRVMSTSAGAVGVIHSLNWELPFTPVDSDLAYGCITIYIDEDILEDSSAGSYTRSWLLEKGRQSSTKRRIWEARGCVSYVNAITLARNALATMSFTTLVASYLTPEAAPAPSWVATPSGNAGRAIGPRTQVMLADYDATGGPTAHVAGFELNPGVVRTPIDVLTEDVSGMPGRFAYTWGRNPTTLTMQVVPQADADLDDFELDPMQEKQIQFDLNAPTGSSWSLYLPRAVPAATPQFANVSEVIGQALNFDGLHEDDESTALARSRVQIVLG